MQKSYIFNSGFMQIECMMRKDVFEFLVCFKKQILERKAIRTFL